MRAVICQHGELTTGDLPEPTPGPGQVVLEVLRCGICGSDLLQHIIDGAPLFSRVVVVGVCMGTDTIEPCMAINKEVDLRFVLGYSPLEYRDALHAIAHGKVRCEALITGHVGLNGVATAFAALGDPNQHAKILIDPKRLDSTVTPYG